MAPETPKETPKEELQEVPQEVLQEVLQNAAPTVHSRTEQGLAGACARAHADVAKIAMVDLSVWTQFGFRFE